MSNTNPGQEADKENTMETREFLELARRALSTADTVHKWGTAPGFTAFWDDGTEETFPFYDWDEFEAFLKENTMARAETMTQADNFVENHGIVYAADIHAEIARFGGRVIARGDGPFGGGCLTIEFSDGSRAEAHFDSSGCASVTHFIPAFIPAM